VTDHGGRIEVESTQNRGTFWVSGSKTHEWLGPLLEATPMASGGSCAP
jgi:hypothetical protein